MYGQLRKYLGEVFGDFVLHKESKVLGGHLKGDHVHMLVSIPPKYAVSLVGGKKPISVKGVLKQVNWRDSDFLCGIEWDCVNGYSR
jgi:putative transposase